MRRFVRESSLSLFFGLLFLLALAGQAFAGWRQFNAAQLAGDSRKDAVVHTSGDGVHRCCYR